MKLTTEYINDLLDGVAMSDQLATGKEVEPFSGRVGAGVASMSLPATSNGDPNCRPQLLADFIGLEPVKLSWNRLSRGR